MRNSPILNIRTVCGFTMIEMIIALAISLIGFTGGLVLYRSAHQTLHVGQASSELQHGLRKALETMTQELQESNGDTIDLSASGAISFASARDTNGFTSNDDGTPDWKNVVVYFVDTAANTLCRYTESKDNWDTNFDTFNFDMDDAVANGSAVQLVPDVTSMTFQLTNNILSITLASSQEVDSLSLSDEYTTEIYIRNSPLTAP